MPYRLLVPNPQQGEVLAIIESTFQEVDAIYNKWNPQSEISRFNRVEKEIRFTLSEKLKKFLLTVDHFVKFTNGKFDPTIEPLQRLWKSRLKKGHIPTNEEINHLMPSLGWQHIEILGTDALKHSEGIELDFGGIAKGFAIDLLKERLINAGIHDFYIEWGGEVRASGKHPAGRLWRVQIPYRLGDPLLIELDNQALATSGDYEQYWEVSENHFSRRYFHILNTQNGRFFEIRTSSVASATVRAADGVTADAIASYLMTFPTAEEAKQWAKNYEKENPTVRTWIFSREEMQSLPSSST